MPPLVRRGPSEAVRAEPVARPGAVAQDAEVPVLQEQRGHGGRYPAVVGAVAAVEIDGIHACPAPYRVSANVAAATAPPMAAPARTWAGVWSRSSTRDQPTTATSGQARSIQAP